MDRSRALTHQRWRQAEQIEGVLEPASKLACTVWQTVRDAVEGVTDLDASGSRWLCDARGTGDQRHLVASLDQGFGQRVVVGTRLTAGIDEHNPHRLSFSATRMPRSYRRPPRRGFAYHETRGGIARNRVGD